MVKESRAMSEDLLSVVVPVYNVAPYLEQSVPSILDQTYRNIEVILVNDGSTDGSEEVCQKYAALDPRVKLSSQENRGVTAARKNGMELATGKYITFVDPDDYIDPDLFRRLMDAREDFDVVVCQWLRESEDGVRRAYDKMEPGAYRTAEDMDFLLDHMVNASAPGGLTNIKPGITSYLWNKLYKTEIAREVYHEIGENIRRGEDVIFSYLYLLRCRSVLITDICGYHYRVRGNSIAHSFIQGSGKLRLECDLYENLLPAFMAHPRRDTLLPQLQLKLSTRISKTIGRMGFAPEAQLELRSYIFPFINLLNGKRIVLCGAGTVGRHYLRQIRGWDLCTVAAWVDPNWKAFRREGLEVSGIETLTGADFDHVVIAALDKAAADEIRSELAAMGIPEHKILWKAPLEL